LNQNDEVSGRRSGDHWEKGSSDVFDALRFIIYGDCATNPLMAKRKVGLFSGFKEKSSLVHHPVQS
jgi:hypothetical protein